MEQTTTYAERVSARVSQQIKDAGITTVWLCEKSGIPRSTMLRRLSGGSAFDLNELERIAEALRVSTESLLGDVA